MNTFKRPLEAIAADFSRSDDWKEPNRTKRLARLMDELESDHGTFKARRLTVEEEQEAANRLYLAISAARKL